jgi:hypothetical protein
VKVGDLVELRVKNLSSDVGIIINNDYGGWPISSALQHMRRPALQRTVLVVWSTGQSGPYWTDSLEVINESR